MPAIAKFIHVIAVELKEETVYGTSVAPLSSATDGVQLFLKQRTGVLVKFPYAFNGDLGPTIGSLGRRKQIAPSALALTVDLPHIFRGAGAAYSASIVPSPHRLLKACGYTATVDVTGGAEKWTYAPTSSATQGTSLTGEFYARGQKAIGAGLIGNLKLDASDLSPPLFTASLSGIGTLPVDASAPTPTYPNSAQPSPPAANCAFTLGNLTAANAMVKKVSWDPARQVKQRTAQQATGSHLGYVPGDRDPLLKITLEATALTTTPFTAAAAFDPYQLRDSGQSFVSSLKYGSAQYGRYTLNLAQAQLADYQELDIDDVPCIELSIAPYNTTDTSNDDHTWVID